MEINREMNGLIAVVLELLIQQSSADLAIQHCILRRLRRRRLRLRFLHSLQLLYLFHRALGWVLRSGFAGYVPLTSQNPHPIIVYSVANYRPHLSHFWANVTVISRTELKASRLLNIKRAAGTIFQPRIFLFLNPCLPEFSYPKNPKNLRPHSSSSTENVPHYSQSSCENATPSSSTSPVVFY